MNAFIILKIERYPSLNCMKVVDLDNEEGKLILDYLMKVNNEGKTVDVFNDNVDLMLAQFVEDLKKN